LVTLCGNPEAVRTELSRGIREQARQGLRDEPGMAGDTIVWLAAERSEWLSGRYVSCAWDMEELIGMEEETAGGQAEIEDGVLKEVIRDDRPPSRDSNVL
jgi:hypothetical protein